MATYKVIQDIEAEDKLIWLFSFRQFVYLLIALFFVYISYLFISVHGWFLDIITGPVVLFFGTLAYPLGKDQPMEVWVLAKIRFLLVPRKRIWTQSGTKNLVTITVPKKIEEIKTNNLNQDQVKSRLQALANTLDTRGWVVKQNSFLTQPTAINPSPQDDRLLMAVPVNTDKDEYSTNEDDILNTDQNPLAQKMGDLITVNEKEHREKILAKLEKIRENSQPQEQKTIPKTKIESATDMKIVQENKPFIAPKPVAQKEENTPTKNVNPAILNLSGNNDYSVTVISHEANKISNKEESEVSIKLH